MRHIAITGWKNGRQITIEPSNLFLGSADFLRADNMEQVERMYDAFLARGGNAIDTAEHYRHSEPAIGAWLEKTGRRDELVIFTKGCHPKREARDVSRVSAACIREDIQHSLETMHTDHVEMFALHRDNPDVPVGEIMEELNRQIEEGHIYAAGVSNWNLRRIVEAQEYAERNGLHPLSFNSPNLSLAHPMCPRWPGCVSADAEMVRYHRKTGLPLVSWSAQGGGFFSGRFTRERCDDEEIRRCYCNDENWERYDRCVALAKERGVTPIQVALAWVLNQPFSIAAVIGPENVDELASSLAGAEIALTSHEVAYLDLEVDGRD